MGAFLSLVLFTNKKFKVLSKIGGCLILFVLVMFSIQLIKDVDAEPVTSQGYIQSVNSETGRARQGEYSNDILLDDGSTFTLYTEDREFVEGDRVEVTYLPNSKIQKSYKKIN